jgi:hypothetical protein
MKNMNWGKGITIFLISFIVFITTLAVILMRANADLESEDYYVREIKYGDEIVAQQNAHNANLSLHQSIDNDGVLLRIEGAEISEEGQIRLIRPDNPNYDITKTFKGNAVFIPVEELNKGKYKVVIDWLDGQPYQLREEIWIE